MSNYKKAAMAKFDKLSCGSATCPARIRVKVDSKSDAHTLKEMGFNATYLANSKTSYLRIDRSGWSGMSASAPMYDKAMTVAGFMYDKAMTVAEFKRAISGKRKVNYV